MREVKGDHWVVNIGVVAPGTDALEGVGLLGTSVTATTEAEAVAELSAAEPEFVNGNRVSAFRWRDSEPDATAADLRESFKRLKVPDEHVEPAAQSFLQFYRQE